MASRWDPPFWIGDRLFTLADMELICWTAEHFADLSRWELAQTICENLPWKAPNGQLSGLFSKYGDVLSLPF